MQFLDENDNVNEKAMIAHLTLKLADQTAAENLTEKCLEKSDGNKEDLPLHLYQCYREHMSKRNNQN